MTKSVKILIGVSVGIAAFIVLGIWAMIYQSYKCAAIPVYQAEISNFELLPLIDIHKELSAQENKFLEQNGIKTLNCFIFQGNPQRPIYVVFMISKLPDDKMLTDISKEKHLLNKLPQLRTALKLCGVNAAENDYYFRLQDYGLHNMLVYRDYLIYHPLPSCNTYLRTDAQKQAFLEKFIRSRDDDAKIKLKVKR